MSSAVAVVAASEITKSPRQSTEKTRIPRVRRSTVHNEEEEREVDNRALEPLTKAANGSEDGELFVRLAQIRIEREEWAPCVSALRKALGKSGLRDPGQAHLLSGICQTRAKNWDGARDAFARAKRHNKTAEQATQWLAHVAAQETQAALDAD